MSTPSKIEEVSFYIRSIVNNDLVDKPVIQNLLNRQLDILDFETKEIKPQT